MAADAKIMVSETQLGEYIVGAYHKLVTDCEVITYNQRPKEADYTES